MSTGRSGSTLLESLLATHPDLVSAGEILLLDHLLAEPTSRCACGELLSACPFWTEVLHLAGPPQELFRETRDAGRVVRREWLLGLCTGRIPRHQRGAVQAYARQDDALTDAIARVAHRPLVVDASKDVYRFAALRSASVEMSVIHLVRDPRGFVCSITGAVDASPSWTRLVRAATRWTIQELLIGVAGRRAQREGTLHRVRYEDLAAHPSDTLRTVAAWLGIDDRFDIEGFRESAGHALGGNPMRSRTGSVRLDDRWHNALGANQQRVVWLLTAPLARAHGYRRLGEGPR